MSDERKPMLSDEGVSELCMTGHGMASFETAMIARRVRDHYESLITDGKLRKVVPVKVRMTQRGPVSECCNAWIEGFSCCPGCGNPIPQQEREVIAYRLAPNPHHITE